MNERKKRQMKERINRNKFYPNFENYDNFSSTVGFPKFDTNIYSRLTVEKPVSRSLLPEFNAQIQTKDNDVFNLIKSTSHSGYYESGLSSLEYNATSDISRSITPISQLSLNRDLLTDSSSSSSSSGISSAISPKSTNSCSSFMDNDKVQINSRFNRKEVRFIFLYI